MLNTQTILFSSPIQTPIGIMIAIADDHTLYLLDFIDRKKYDIKIAHLQKRINALIIPQANPITESITQELEKYFAGTLQHFTTPRQACGTPFQHTSWKALTKIRYGETITYAQQALSIGNKKAFRAVARANSNNTLAIIIPCHRVIGSDKKICGYAGGIDRKQWLIDHEKKVNDRGAI